MSIPSLPPEQRTMVTPREGGHNVEPIPGMEVCDFCTGTPVTWSYPCGPVIIDSPTGRHVSTDPWGACDECHALIETDQPDMIVARAAHNALAEVGPVPDDIALMVVTSIATVQRQFHAERLGAPQPK